MLSYFAVDCCLTTLVTTGKLLWRLGPSVAEVTIASGMNNMVPEINIIDENPPIFDLEWMDQCADKVNKFMMILAFDNSKMV